MMSGVMLKGLNGVERQRKVIKVHLNSNELLKRMGFCRRREKIKLELNQMTLMLVGILLKMKKNL